VLLARQAFGLDGNLRSDCASVQAFTVAAQSVGGLRFMRDPTRGGIATVANEISLATGLGITLDEASVPVSDEVRGVCDMLGFDPLYLACEGRVVAVVAPAKATELLDAWHRLPNGERAAIVGQIASGRQAVALRTVIGGHRLLAELEDDPLPRIC
jgi:hydrogenase expression/formation protein HypE